MVVYTVVMAPFIHLTLCALLLLATPTISSSSIISTPDDIACLKSIKDSLEDPLYRLNSSWNLNNNTSDFICHFDGVDCWHFDENKVVNLHLVNMGLRGSFPRGLANCKSITGLNLSGNQISGTIPSDISKKLPYVSVLDLSNNNLSGEIPPDIANCSYLNVLKLDNNMLTGQIPTEIGKLGRLRMFSVSNNFLTGPVPRFFFTVEAESYANNDGLCGLPLGSCLKSSPVSFIDGFFVGYFVFILLVFFLFIWFFMPKQSKNKKAADRKRKNGRRLSTIDARRIDITISMLEKLVTRMNLKEIREVTSDFSKENVIGLGNMGKMYKATLANGWFLAVKRLHSYQNFKRQFVSELMTLGRLRHINLVPLLGFCIEKKEMLLIYKYISNGTLYDWLHNDPKVIDWPLRVKIAIGLARGLAWIHYNSNIQVIHLNINSKCILLDSKFEPKLSNFGEAIFVNPNENDQSTRDFTVNREFWEMGFAKKDVYSFGNVLFELITGRDCTLNGNSKEWLSRVSTSSSGFYDAIGIDRGIVGNGNDGDIFKVLRIACDCVQVPPQQRPTMLQVYRTLRSVGERYGLIDDSDMLSQVEISMYKLGFEKSKTQ